jgi:hypothetical protein
MATCRLCGKVVNNIGRHRAEVHRDELLRILAKSREAKRRKKNRNQGPSIASSSFVGTAPTANIKEANYVTITPTTFTMSSALLWQAREAAINIWHWPADISMEDFIDTFLYIAFKERGIILGAYVVEDNQRR